MTSPLLRPLLVLACAALPAGCSSDSNDLARIEVGPVAAAIAAGTTQVFTATGVYEGGQRVDMTDSVAWQSADPGIATSTDEITTGVASGIVTITAFDGASGIRGAASLTVTDPIVVSLGVTPPAPQLALGTATQLTAMGTFTDATVQDLTGAVSWVSSNGAVVTVAGGLVVSTGTGTATVTATDPGTGVDSAVLLTVTPAVLTAIDLTPTVPSLALGTEQPFVATGIFSDSTVQDLTAILAWSSAAPGVATIDANGLAVSLATGTTTITAIDPGTMIAGSTLLTVTSAELVSIALTPADSSIALGPTRQFNATGTYTDLSNQDLTSTVIWSSSAIGVAAVSNASGSQGLASSVGSGVTTITATDPGTTVAGTTALTVTAAELVSIAVTPTSSSVALGTAQQFTATGTYTNATNVNLTASVTWTSSAIGVATISNAGGSEGLASSAASGVTTITAMDPGTMLAGDTTLTVTAAELVSISVHPGAPSIALGLDQAFTAIGIYSDASNQDLTSTVTWNSSAPGVATISNAGGSKGLATSAAVGAATITATDPATMIAGDTTLTVTPATLVSISVTPADPSVALGLNRQFTAIGTYTDASNQDLTSSVTWSSSATGVATVSNAGGSQGLASSMATGVTTITATDPGTMVVDVTILTVTSAELVSIAVTPADVSIALGTDQQFTAMGSFTDATNQDLTSGVTWGSSATGVATISNAGGSQGLASSDTTGMVTITATDPGSMITGDTSLTVTPAVLLSIAVTPGNLTITNGSSEPFIATGTYSDASVQDVTAAVTWTSTAAGVATISNAGGSEGLATAASSGSTTIAATEPGSMIAGSTSLYVINDIAFVAAATASDASALDLDVSTPAGTAPGDVLVATIALRPDTASITPPAGWTLVRRMDNGDGAANSLAIYRRVADSGEPAMHRWSFSSSTGSAGAIASFRGVDLSAPIDTEAGVSTANSTAHAAPSLTTTSPRTMLVTAHGFSSSTTWTHPAGMTEAADIASLAPDQATGIALCVAYEFQPAAGATGTRSATASSSADTGNAHALALSPGP